ncbi:MAG: bifunctional phosphoribosyl-AMP cyclohydrolase/phosphoribosyl-ATP diphosphatase HisIE [Candidatus Bathyarchaeia archaeon]
MEKKELEILLNKLDFEKGNGLIPAVTKEHETGKILMLAYMSREALAKTLETKTMHYWSRSKKRIWIKGETSGHYQYVKSAYADCDYDALLFSVRQAGYCCHLGFSTCFHNKIFDDEEKMSSSQILNEVFNAIRHRIASPKPNSYVSALVSKGENGILEKVNEEASEFLSAIKARDRKGIIHEATDLIFHVLIALAKASISLEDIYEEFFKRRKERESSHE